MGWFVTLNAAAIAARIREASRRVILVAPGAWPEVGSALCDMHRQLGAGNVVVVLDVSARTARLGLGTFQSVESLLSAGIDVRDHPGLRMGVLICDGYGWSFAMAPALVEPDPTTDTDAFNALALTGTQVEALLIELPPCIPRSEDSGVALAAPTRSVASTDDAETVLACPEPAVGAVRVTPETLDKTRGALKIAPPQPFDLSRRAKMYSSLVEFVELEFVGFRLESHSIRLPSSLSLLATKDKEVKKRVQASLRILDGMNKPDALNDIAELLEDLRKAYLVPVGRAGRVMLKSKREQFEGELAEIEDQLTGIEEVLVGDLDAAITHVFKTLEPDLARAVLAGKPAEFRGLYSDSEDGAREFVRHELEKIRPDATKLVAGMCVRKFYKELTYQTLRDKEFMARLDQLIPQSVRQGAQLFDAETVARGGEFDTP